MGKANLSVFHNSENTVIVGALEVDDSPFIGKDAGILAGMENIGVSIGSSLESTIQKTDVIIDFTTASATLAHIQMAKKHKKAMVIGTTGFQGYQLAMIEEYALTIPIVLSPNMSPGVNTLFHLVGQAARLLGDVYDVEIVEIHHNKKKDAPSGTAIEFGRIIAEARNETLNERAVYNRQGNVGERKKGEIGIMALRAADVVGDHTILFGGPGERIEFTHRSNSRINYATGALMAALFLADKERGLFSLSDVLGLPKY
jgi:4-hydroxy-tetrahydrodipicolinate reductase